MLLSGLERGEIRARTLSALRVLVKRLVRHELTKTRRWRTIRILAEHGEVLSAASRTKVNPN